MTDDVDPRFSTRGQIASFQMFDEAEQHHLVCADCSAYYRGVPNCCPHCQDGYMG